MMERNSFSVLLVEDNPGDALLIQELLAEASGSRYRLEWANRLSTGLARLAAGGFDLVLLDLSLPDSSGLDTFRTVQSQAPAVPVVVLTGLNDEAVAVQAVQEGAQDYLPKGLLEGNLLARALRYAIERQRLIVQLEAERNWLHTVIDRSPAAIILVEDATGRRIRANPRAEDLFGFRLLPDGGIGQYAEYLCHPNGQPLRYEQLAAVRALRGETIMAQEQVIYRPDGQEVPILTSASPIWGRSDEVVGAVVLFDDISHMKELERLKEQWASVIAHDLRQPVSVIMHYAALLEQEAPDRPSQRAGTQHILAAARQLTRMTADLADMSRIEAQQLTLERQTVDVAALVGVVVERMATSPRRNVLRLEVTGAIPPVSADPGRLEQVLSNLIANAVKYGYADTDISVIVQPQEDEVRVSVVNAGDGIPAEELTTLFARFRRAQQVRERRIEGLGLGLYIAKGLVEAHGGRIWVESIPRQTTAFHFTLPLRRAPELEG
ncbi:MAG: response regulator [Chloroflexi bacterium]|nr:response regulator [Chloroflexota bacterium]